MFRPTYQKKKAVIKINGKWDEGEYFRRERRVEAGPGRRTRHACDASRDDSWAVFATGCLGIQPGSPESQESHWVDLIIIYQCKMVAI